MKPGLFAGLFAMLLALCGPLGAAEPAPQLGASRGELLYSTHCLTCHTAEVHWRDKRLARDLPGLRAQVDRWQRSGNLGWDSLDINEVVRYLDQHYYRFPARE